MRKILILLFAGFMISSAAIAQSNQWTGASGTNWHLSSNWSLNRIPLATDDVVIPGAPANKPIISGSNAVCWGITIQSGATLTIQSSRTLTVNGHWSNQAGASGFVANTGSIVFAGTINQQIDNSSGTEIFYHLTVNKPGSTAMTYCNFVIMGNFTLLGGDFSAQTTGKTYTFYGNVAFNGSGIFWPQGTCYFRGATNTSYQNGGYSSYFVDVVLEKTNTSNKLTLFADMACFGADIATVHKGILDLGGFRFQSNAPMQINNGGKMFLPPGSILNIRNSLQINSGGEMEVAGHPDNPPLIYNDSGSYSFDVNSGGSIKAEHAIFQKMNLDGIHIKAGATVDPDRAFNFCSFGFGVSGGVLLTINNNQTFTVTEANFEVNFWGGVYNVRKSVNSGNVTFYACSGAFAGEDYDDDPYNRLNWVTGVPTNYSVYNQQVYDGINACYNAKQTLTTQYFYVYNGGQATLIAGQNIILLPHNVVYAGGYFHAWITTDESYCGNVRSIVASDEANDHTSNEISEPYDPNPQFRIYPNPANGKIFIDFYYGSEECILDIFNVYGEIILSAKLLGELGNQIDITDLNNGVYMVRLTANGRIEVGKLIKAR